MYEKNEALLYAAPSHMPRRSGEALSPDELDVFIQEIQAVLEEGSRDAFSKDMRRQVGVESNYKLKDKVLQGLNLIREKWHAVGTAASEKAMIALKLKERSEECTPGFHNGVNEVLDGFYIADSLEALVYRVRQDIVRRVASRLTDETHNNNRVFTVAEDAGYGVQALNREDVNLEVFEILLSDDTIRAALKQAFQRELNVFALLTGVEAQLHGQLSSFGYSGLREEGYGLETTGQILDYLFRLFRDTPEVQAYQASKVALEQAREDARVAREHAEDQIEALFERRGIKLASHKSSKLKALLGERSALNLPFIQTFLNELPEGIKPELDEIKKAYLRHDTSSASQAAFEAYEQAKSLFFVIKKDKEDEEVCHDIHWPHIKQLLWQSVKAKKYYRFSTSEEALMDALTAPDGTFHPEDLKAMVTSVHDYASILRYISPSHHAAFFEASGCHDKLLRPLCLFL